MSSGKTCSPPRLLRRRAGERVDAFVFGVTVMALDPHPFDPVRGVVCCESARERNALTLTTRPQDLFTFPMEVFLAEAP